MTASTRLALATLLASIVAASALAQPAAAPDGSKPSETTTWAKGIVRDEAGEPMAGAKVYARATYDGAIRTYALLHAATTDASGRYLIEGEKNLSSFSASLVAHVPGRPPAFAWVQSEMTWDAPGVDRREISLPKGDIDFVIPRSGGKMEVLVTRGGQQAAGVGVALRLQGADPFDSWGHEQRTELYQALHAICRPVGRTGSDGIARFDALAPGLYSIVAPEGDDQSVRGFTEYSRWFPFGDEPTYGEARNIPVRADQTTTHRLAMFRHGCVTKFSIQRDGKDWIAEEQLMPQVTSPTGDHGGTATRIGKEWTDTFRFEQAGLKQVSFIKYTGSSRFPRSFPFDSADGVVAASPRLSNAVPVTLVASPNRGAGILVRIEDAEGRPRAGLARFGNTSFQDVSQEGTRLDGFEPGLSRVEARASGVARIFPSENMGTMPTDDALTGRSEILPQHISVGNNEMREVTLKPEKVGYVKGRVRLPEGKTLRGYQISLGKNEYQNGAGVFFKSDTGEFLAGPFRTGTVALFVSQQYGLGRLSNMKEVRVQAGQVTEADLEAPPDIGELPRRRRSVSGQVLLSDGKSPAHLAAVARHFAADDRPWGVGMTDFTGKIWPHSVWVPYRENDPELPGTPRDPYVAAWLPGRCGVTFAPPPELADQPISITLPPAISLRGQVRVEGDGETVDNGTIEVRAQHQGLGKLDDLLSVQTTAGADGAFELAGLTPGKYRVQAALDGIWLSPSAEVAVQDADPPPLSLTIPAPGGPVLVRLLGSRGDAGPEKLLIARPAGPLTDKLWPEHFTPDGANIVRIPALEAGEHTIRVGDQSQIVTVPPLTLSGGKPLEVLLERNGGKSQ